MSRPEWDSWAAINALYCRDWLMAVPRQSFVIHPNGGWWQYTCILTHEVGPGWWQKMVPTGGQYRHLTGPAGVGLHTVKSVVRAIRPTADGNHRTWPSRMDGKAIYSPRFFAIFGQEIYFNFRRLRCSFGSTDTWTENKIGKKSFLEWKLDDEMYNRIFWYTLCSQSGIPITLKLAGFNRLRETFRWSWNVSLIWATSPRKKLNLMIDYYLIIIDLSNNFNSKI
jgi:hypothetical protein